MFGEKKISLADKVQLLENQRINKLAAFYELRDSLTEDNQVASNLIDEIQEEMDRLKGLHHALHSTKEANEATIAEVKKVIGS